MSKKSRTSSRNVRINRNAKRNSSVIHNDERARKRAEYLAAMPKTRLKRILYKLKPANLAHYWFTKEGGIMALKLLGVGIICFMILILTIFAFFGKDLPKTINLNSCTQGESSNILARDGSLLYATSGNSICTPVTLDNISPYLRESVVASEDKSFYKEGAFSVRGLGRAFLNDITGGSTQGGSTITQQYVKNSLLKTQARTVSRKIVELVVSIDVERKYSKDAILNAYLNEIPFGSIYNGAEAASRGYFNKEAKDLTIDEAALLTAIIPAPTYYSPYGSHKADLVIRQDHVIDLMVQQGMITKAQGDAAKKIDTLAKITNSGNNVVGKNAPFFVDEAENQAACIYSGLDNSECSYCESISFDTTIDSKCKLDDISSAGLTIVTTLNPALQKVAENNIAAVKVKEIAAASSAAKYGATEATTDDLASVALDAKTGQVLAEVGGSDYTKSEINNVTAPHMPGSSYKLYDYSSLMATNKNWGAGSTLYDVPTNFGDYTPQDSDQSWENAESMRKAFGDSRNIPAIKAMYIAGIQNTVSLSQKMGLVSGYDCGGSCSLGSAIGSGSLRLDEHANSYATASRGGVYKPETYILSITDSSNKSLYQWKDSSGEQVIDPQIAYSINDMLSTSYATKFAIGFNNTKATLPGNVKVASKTGTSEYQESNMFMGYTNDLVYAMWAGGVKGIGPDYSLGTYFAEYDLAPGWTSFMTQADSILNISNTLWSKPSNMKTVCIDTNTGYSTTSGGSCDIFPSWYNPQFPSNSQATTIDSVSGLLATDCTPLLARKAESGGGFLPEIPASDPSFGAWVGPIIKLYGPVGGSAPTATDNVHGDGNNCFTQDQPSVQLSATQNSDHSYTISATVTQGKASLTTLNFKLNGSIINGGSLAITSSGTYPSPGLKFTVPAGTGSGSLTADVIDANLYDITSNAITVTGSSTSLSSPTN